MQNSDFSSSSGSDPVNLNAPVEPEPDLCKRCKAMLIGQVAYFDLKGPGSPIPSAYQDSYETVDLLESTANQGCALCQLFIDQMSSTDRQRLRRNHEQPSQGELPIVGEFHTDRIWRAEGGQGGSIYLRYFESKDGALIKDRGWDGLFSGQNRVDMIP